ncbi:YiiX/YebB-like N1pC/P60 family cysteine hydrolase [Cupriavidus sp. TMH.W2]|uniref:YiiX/YebB-like N1pC/P60 family cysteine hydrolase n=1 Tax=Cupriavidus sp. TMH.W2 TaxID=3434465 RepID=UPI003D77E132
MARALSDGHLASPLHPPTDLNLLARLLQPCDVLLVEGNRRISTAIKYLTQSTWSHAALFVGRDLGRNRNDEPLVFIDADAVAGVRGVPISEFGGLHARICRPFAITPADAMMRVIDYAIARLGEGYDLKNVVDLARYLIPTPPVPSHWRRRMLALGSGDPTQAICSTLIAQAFQSVRYPILPVITRQMVDDPMCRACVKEIFHVRHHSLFVPRDFDVSPYFQVINPGAPQHLDYKNLAWTEWPSGAQPGPAEALPAVRAPTPCPLSTRCTN